MKSSSDKLLLRTISLLVCLAAPASAAEFAKALPPAAAPVAAVPAQIPQSVFNVPSSPKEGRNPFFPRSTAAGPAAPTKQLNVDASTIVLNGITSPPKRTAMINGRTFEAGEEGEIKAPNGSRILIKCVEIRNDSAVISVAGQLRELRLRFGV